MEFIHEKKRYVEEVVRTLKHGGLFFVLTHKPPSKHGLKLDYLEKMLVKNFKLLEVQNPSTDTLNIIAVKRW